VGTIGHPLWKQLQKDFLGSQWVARFQDVEIGGDRSVPEQMTSMDSISLRGGDADGSQGFVPVEKLAIELSVVQAGFEKAIDYSFEGAEMDRDQKRSRSRG
jgi:hypothetical protein